MKGGMRKLFLLLFFLLLTALAAPRLVVEPDDGVKPLLDLIASAREEILVKMYLWTPSRLDVVDALGEAVARGVKVKVLLEREPSGGRVDLSSGKWALASSSSASSRKSRWAWVSVMCSLRPLPGSRCA